MAEQKAYYAIIPANVRYDADLPPNAKLLYGEITALCNERGFCWASNSYFADLYGVSKKSISKWIGALADKNYIKASLVYKDGSKEIDKRYITLVTTPMEEKFHTYGRNCGGGMEENFTTPMEEKFAENNTSSFNTTSNKKKERKSASTSYDTILSSSVFDESLKELYLEYIKMRKLIKAPMTDRALTMLISKVNQLEPNSIDRQKKMLETAIMNNWKSVYPLKDEPQKPQQKTVGFDLDEFFNAACLDSEKKRIENPPKTAGNDESIRERAEQLKRQLS